MASRDSRYNASQHYVWRQDVADVLGEGAYGTVYRGVHKETGELVAIKTFNRTNMDRTLTSHRGEFDILTRLSHPNIVRFITIENVMKGPRALTQASSSADNMCGKVLVMELCSAGNLYAILNSPKYQFGFDDEEFLEIFSQLTEGLRYLHQNKIIHRDWKPSNILKITAEDGSVRYKLCDFGAARICEEDGKFTSMVGTVEYCHPDILGEGRRNGCKGVFSATSDLWSIGVTLYQIATSKLPFIPYGGRKNVQMMNKMTREKKNGVIAGFQEFENGPIAWSSHLPDQCLLSCGLRPLVEKLLGSLLDADNTSPNALSFDGYFREARKILQKVPLKVYILGEHYRRTVYLDELSDFEAFRDAIASQTGQSADNFVFFIDDQLLNSSIWISKEITSKCSIIAMPLYLVESKPPVFPKEPLFIERDVPSLDWDADTAKTCCALAYWIKRLLHERKMIIDTLIESIKKIKISAQTEFSSFYDKWRIWMYCWQNFQMQLKLWEQFCCTESTTNVIAAKRDSALQISQSVSAQETELLNLNSQLLDVMQMQLNYDKCKSIDALENMLENMEAVYTQFRQDKALFAYHNVDCSYNDEQWHCLRRKQLKKYWETCRGTLYNNELDAFVKLTEESKAVFTAVHAIGQKLAKTRSNLTALEEMMRAFGESLEKVADTHLLTKLTEQPVQNGNPSMNGLRSALTADMSGAPTHVLETLLAFVKQAQEMRSLAQKNRELFDKWAAVTAHQLKSDRFVQPHTE